MKIAIVQFPGSNCDQDCLAALRGIDGVESDYVWHKETSLHGWDAIVLPGGFSYGDYLRCGAIARFSPIMRSVVEEARSGQARYWDLQWLSNPLRSRLAAGCFGAQSLAPFRLSDGDDTSGGVRFAVHPRHADRDVAASAGGARGRLLLRGRTNAAGP
jgi:hypothetical protein